MGREGWFRQLVGMVVFVGSLMLLAPVVSIVKGQYSGSSSSLSSGVTIGTGGRIYFEDANGYIQRTAGTNYMYFAPASGTSNLGLGTAEITVGGSSGTAANWPVAPNYALVMGSAASGGAQWNMGIGTSSRQTNSGASNHLWLVTGDGQSSGTGSAAGNIYIYGGDGQGSGNNAGGSIELKGGSPTGSGTIGVVKFGDAGTKPTCASGIRGAVWYDAGGAGVADTFEVCRKDSGDAYAWVSVY